MRTRWLTVALVFSVMVNVAAIGTIGYHWWKVRSVDHPLPPPHRPMLKPLRHPPLSLTPDQMQGLEAQRRRITEEIREIRSNLFKSRARLMELLRSPDPDSMAVEEILQEIASSQIALERTVIHNILRMRQVLTPEQREKLLQMIEQRGGWDRMMERGWEHREDARLRRGMRGRRDRGPNRSPDSSPYDKGEGR